MPVPAPDKTPYMFMGRVVKAAGWSPGRRTQYYLPNYKDTGGNALYLTSIGFVGAAFSGYYPDCRSVFGFWDTFADLNAPGDIYEAISGNTAGVKFRVSYSVIGWLPAAGDDPLTTLPADVLRQYNQYVSAAQAQQAKVTRTPADVFNSITAEQYGWQFSGNAISYHVRGRRPDADRLSTCPDGTLCAGVIGQVVWDQTDPATDTPFLAARDDRPALAGTGRHRHGQHHRAGGLRPGQGPPHRPRRQQRPGPAELRDPAQRAAARACCVTWRAKATRSPPWRRPCTRAGSAGIDGGHRWTIQTKAAPGSQSSVALTLPLPLAEQLATLNSAQLAYDQARSRLLTARQQLFMDWVIYVKQLSQEPAGTPVIPPTR